MRVQVGAITNKLRKSASPSMFQASTIPGVSASTLRSSRTASSSRPRPCSAPARRYGSYTPTLSLGSGRGPGPDAGRAPPETYPRARRFSATSAGTAAGVAGSTFPTAFSIQTAIARPASGRCAARFARSAGSFRASYSSGRGAWMYR